VDFAEADLGAGLALVHLAEMQSTSRRDVSRALREAEEALQKGRLHAFGLPAGDSRRIESQLEKLQTAIDRVRALSARKHAAGGSRTRGRVVAMPNRRLWSN
jgi:hypothetical protein